MTSLPLVEFRRVSKRCGKVLAADSLSFSVTRGSIHGLIGENGAGKTTAMKLLDGLDRPDSGEIFFDGKPLSFSSPMDAMKAGIGMVHQHFMLAGPETALDNLLLQEAGPGLSRLPRERRARELSGLAAKYGLEIPLDEAVENLSVGSQQKLEILKVLSQDARLLILDEPTAVLTPQEVRDFFENLRRLRDEGKTIIIVTHKLKEIMALTDEVTVLRKGRVVAVRKTRETSLDELAELMIGRRVHKAPGERSSRGGVVVRAKELRTTDPRGALTGLSFELHSREILGIAGVDGNGQEALLRCLSDPRTQRKGLAGRLETAAGVNLLTKGNRELRREGWAFFPEDRLRFGVLKKKSAVENFLLGQSDALAGAVLSWPKIREACQRAMNVYDVQPPDPDLPLENFSGGNQQKFVVARELHRSPQVLIAAQPTRGVDLGAVSAIHDILLRTRDEGAAILLVSSELDELMSLSDRILVLERGRAIAEFSRGTFDEFTLGRAMGGQELRP